MAANYASNLRTLARLMGTKGTAIEVYKANFATPDGLEAMRFWLQGELNRIQGGFSSTDEVVKLIANILSDIYEDLQELTDGIDGIDGEGGSFTPDTFEGAGTTGYVPDPLSESGRYLRDDGTFQIPPGGGTGTDDHGALLGLGDDDHPQYYNQARGQAEFAPLVHDHDAGYF